MVRVGADDLMWSEVADALWLASVTEDTLQRPPEPPPASPDIGQPPAGSQPPVSRVRSAEPQERIEPIGLPIDQLKESAPPERDSEDGAWTRPGESDERRHGEEPHLRPTDLGGGPQPRTVVLAGSADIVRALRSLKRKVPSRHEVVLDEEATAEQAIQDRLWWPMTRPATVRWLDLTLVIDASPSMVLWQPIVKAFISLAEQLGAFRTIQLRLLDTDHSTGGPVTPLLFGGTPGTPARSPAELLDPSGQRIVLVLTDGIGRCWRQDLVSPLLAMWGGAMPVAVVQLLPQRLWERNGLALHRARLTVPGALRPNLRWKLELSDAWLTPDLPAVVSAGVVPIPVLELEARWLGWWARLITGGYHDPADATVLLVARQATQERTPPEGAQRESDNGMSGWPLSAQERVRNFFSVASPMAFRLATLLAAVPVSVPIAQLVQAELVPESGPDHLAEVFFTSGLLRAPNVTASGRSWDTATFTFDNEVREVLLSGARRAETAQVVRLVTERLGGQINTFRHFRAALDAPDSTADPAYTAHTADYVALERMVMQALSGPYLSRASRLRASERDSPFRAGTGTGTGAEVINNDTMSPVTKHADLASAPPPQLAPVPDSPPTDAEPLGDPAPVGTFGATRPGGPTTFGSVAGHDRQPDDPPPVWGNVPPRNLNFTGREELLGLLSERLTAGGATAVLPAALHGMGGIGKTQMAVEYVYQHLQDYDVIWWIQAAQPAQIRAGLTELAQRLGLPGSAEANTAVPAVREALRVGNPFRRWLLIFDSAEAPEMVRPFFPSNGPGEILITSRNPDWAGIARPLEVAVFKREESKELLGRRGPEMDEGDADRLAEALGDLPLAIEQAAAWLAETGMPVREYLRLFDEKVAEILDTSAPADYEVSVAAAWNVSFDNLRVQNPAAHQLLQVCAFFSPEPISRSLFTGVRGVSISPELDAALRDPISLSRAIRDINRYSLAKIDYRNDTLQLHRLVQLVLRNRMPTQRQAEMCHGAHLLLANLDPNDPVPAKNWPRYQDVLPHAYAAKVVDCDDPWVRQLIINLMVFLYQWGDHDEACRLAQDAVTAWTEKLGEADPQTLQAARNLGYFLWTVGRYAEAAAVNVRTVELHRQVSGSNSEETLIAEIAVATDLKGRGDFIAALDLNREIYQKAKGLFGDDDPTTLTTAHDLVVSLGLAGKYRDGQRLAEDTYRRRADVLGYDNPSTSSTLNALILDRREAGDYTWARIEQEKLAERSRELFGSDRAATLRRFHHLSVARRKSGDHQGARELSGDILLRFRLRYGDEHPNAMACALAHSIDLRHAGELEASRQLGEQTFTRYRESLGEHHPHTLSALIDLAVTLRQIGDVAGARKLNERSLEQFRAMLGPDHPHAIVNAINLTSDLAALGETEGALKLGSEALERAQRVLDTDHPTTLAAAMNLVLDLRAVGRTQEAETRYADVVTRYHRVLGKEHPASTGAAAGTRADCDIDPLPL